MTDDKVYYPEVVPDASLANPTEEVGPSGGKSEGTINLSPTKSENLPTPKTAYELLSTALNTKSRKIGKEFQFTKTGAIKIGQFEFGKSGEVRISPSGIVGIDPNGEITFTLDAETGDAVFKGIIQSGAVIAGRVIVGDGEKVIIDGTGEGSIIIKNADNETFIDAQGLVSDAAFRSGTVNSINSRDIISTSFTDVSNTTILTPDLPRAVKVLVIMNAVGRLYLPDTDTIASGEIILTVDTTDQTGTIFDQVINDTRMSTSGVFTFDGRNFSVTGTDIITLAAGIHTLKLRAKVSSQTLRILQTSITYLVLGT